MRKTIKITLLVALLAVSLPSAWGFSLLGPLGSATGGEPWQQLVIGYGPQLGDIGGPHNIGEEYRRVTPVMYYAYNANFLGFFGLAGTANVDLAFGIMNAVTNVSSYSPALDQPNEFSFVSQSYNPTAQALFLLDIKSVTLALLVEQMGLAEPERYTWTLHDRDPGNGSPCFLTVLYTVVMRNFNILDTPLNEVQYSPYVNDILYSYYILEVCSGSPVLAQTVPFPVDPGASTIYSSVAGFALQFGGFYTGLTRDDVAGLRYLYSSNNINFENTSSSGGQLLFSNALAQIQVTTLSFSLLFAQAATNDPATLSLLYPGLAFLSVQTNIVNQFGTNIFAFYTNVAGPFTNHFGPFTNTSGSYASGSPIQYGNFVTPNPVTLSLGEFLAAAATNDPAALQLLYPDLILSQVVTNAQQVQVVANTAPYFTNQIGLPVYTNNLPGGLTNGFYFTNQPGPTAINFPLTSQLFTNVDLFQFSQQIRTNDPATLQALYPSLVIVSSYSTPTNTDVPNVVTYFTNALPGYPLTSPPRLVTVTNGFTRIFYNLYYYVFGNVITNHVYSSALVNIATTYITNRIGSPYQNNYTNVINTSYYTNLVSGDILIIPTNWCGFQITFSYSPYPVMGVSNTVGTASFTNVFATNTYFFSQTVFYTFTNRTYNVRPGICEPVLFFPTNFTTNIVNSYSYVFGNVVTNHFYTNTFVKISTTNVFSLPGGNTNTFSTNILMAAFYTNKPSGDIFIVPSAWCGYAYVVLLTNLNATTNVFTAGGVPTLGQYFNRTTIAYFTNYTLSIKPGFCGSSLMFGTNYGTNIVTTYTYVFGNIITNHYYPNTCARVVTSNLMLVPFGQIGALTNIVTTNLCVDIGPSGDFYIVPPNFCGLVSNSLLSTTVFTITSQFVATNAVPDLGERFTQTTTYNFTNYTFLMTPYVCFTQPSSPALRRGIEHVQFVRANFDSLIGQFFQPITNRYTMTVITNSQQVTENYQRVITTPDILLTAQDFATTPSDNIIGIGGTVARSINFDASQILPGLAGPGTIRPTTVFTYNKVGPIFLNGPFLNTNSFTSVNEFSQHSYSILGAPYNVSLLQWASFDTQTNSIVLYPNGTSLANLANSIFIQMLPASPLVDGTAGSFYSVTFSATGGQPPYVWSAPNLSALFPGMSFNPATQVLSGTPNVAGTFNFTIQLTDSVNRIVTYSYTITIH